MEEQVGIRWHHLVTRLADTRHPQAAVMLERIAPRLATVLRALGADPGLGVRASPERRLATPRRWLQKLAGTGRRHAVAWRDDDGLRLPPVLDTFDQIALNEGLGLWLVALASRAPAPGPADDWAGWNRRLVAQTLDDYPGLAELYGRLARTHVAQRPRPALQESDGSRREAALQAALLEPRDAPAVPPAAGDPLPVPLWLYPVEAADNARPPSDDAAEERPAAAGAGQQLRQRKRASYVDDIDGRSGLLVFRLESLFSWSEFIPLDRTADDDDTDAARVAEDLDHLSLSRKRSASSSRLRVDLDLPSATEDDIPLGEGRLLPEWDWRKAALLPDHCRVVPMLPRGATPLPLPARLQPAATRLRQRFESLRPQKSWLRRQADGDVLDLSACVDFSVQRQLGSAPGQPLLWRRQSAQQRDLACLVLADLSLSTEAAIDDEHQVIDVIRDSLHLLGEALDAGGDAFSMYGFSSRRRDHVRLSLIKNFADAWGDEVRGRVQSLRPGYYTRMGAAIRQATEILGGQAAEQRLLLLLTDGKPNDLDLYEGRYGMEDTRHALMEARRAGLQPFCVTIDQEAADYLPHLFGAQRFHLLRRAQDLPRVLPQLYLLLTGRSP
ncbi:MAG: VWA domain-containing protein [Pseudomonadota bacterium]|uniref:nitric oxide reductase activation protein NorD n=1 Tax=Methyloversatilis sp. TaxID=2569862 RepID=UPI002737593C|nr:VWA domain-containing protein [Methyloversatilis sp.]MDP3871024.1 nitric oxide reductase [Methyloversatilis sp.]